MLAGCFNSPHRIPALHQEAENVKPEKLREGPKISFIAFGQKKVKKEKEKNWERDCDSVLLFNFSDEKSKEQEKKNHSLSFR